MYQTKFTLIATLAVLMLVSCTNPQNIATPYVPGFRVIHAVDSSRIYKPNTATVDYLHFRPIDIDLWYPAQASEKDSVLTFGQALGLLESRANYYTASTTGNGLTTNIAKSLCEGVKCSTPDKLLQQRSGTYKNEAEVKGRFPLILYMASFNGMAYENIALLEDLVRQGYIVASISSIGGWPGDMTMKRSDLMEQVHDATYALALLKKRPDVDSTRLGVIGYSWGGLAGAVLTSVQPDIDALVSLDGSEFHHYGKDKQEDIDFDGIKNILAARSIAPPYLRLESDQPGGNPAERIYNFSEKLSGQAQVFTVYKASHEDFSHLPTLVRESGNCPNTRTYSVIRKLSVAFLTDHLTGTTNRFKDSLKVESTKTVAQRPAYTNR